MDNKFKEELRKYAEEKLRCQEKEEVQKIIDRAKEENINYKHENKNVIKAFL